jgi:hypothetical protein
VHAFDMSQTEVTSVSSRKLRSPRCSGRMFQVVTSEIIDGIGAIAPPQALRRDKVI